MPSRRHFNPIALLLSTFMILPAMSAHAQAVESAVAEVAGGNARQSLDEAWWTGPILAANAETLPPGHVYIEPYLFDVLRRGSATPGSLSYLLYGVAPRFTAGVLPSFSYAENSAGRRHLRMGDATLNFQYRLTAANPRKTTPTVALVVQPRLPTARHDRLATAGSGAGNGNYATMAGVYTQQYLWLPNGRIMRARLNVTHTFEGTARVRDISVYGTPAGFRGRVRPGSSTVLNAAVEYSLTKRFVIALDVLHQWNGPTRVRDDRTAMTASSKRSSYFAIAPGLEYNWSPSQGVIAGARWIPAGHNSSGSLTPVVAYSLFL